jgi:hypothetical protein
MQFRRIMCNSQYYNADKVLQLLMKVKATLIEKFNVTAEKYSS